MREAEKVIIKKSDNKRDDETYTHPAFGSIEISQVEGGENILFGSSIEHSNKISIKINHAEMHHSSTGDRNYPKKCITEIELSYSQFGELLSSMNHFGGVPCTIRYIENIGYIPAIAENISKRKQFRNEFIENVNKAMEDVQEQINVIQNTLNAKKNLTVVERKEIISRLSIVKNNIGYNLDFMASQFDEQMDKTVVEAKGEIEAFCQNKMMSIASRAIMEKQEELAKIESPISIDNLIE